MLVVSTAILLLPPPYMGTALSWFALAPLGLGFAAALGVGRRRAVSGAVVAGTTLLWGSWWTDDRAAYFTLLVLGSAILVALTVVHARARRIGAIAPGLVMAIVLMTSYWPAGLLLGLTALALIAVLAEFLVTFIRNRQPAEDTVVVSPRVLIGHTAEGVPIYESTSAVSQRTNSFALTALILGLVVGPLAIPFGHVALSQIQRTGENGRGLAIAGLVLGYLALAVWLAVATTLIVAYVNL
jgi:hypothetical protein